ncbi:conserved hypothetical protein [Sphingomonas sp. EC-HK361]|nr:conserved hypothetical protein [Sphingomonas sp. EC-HK361]
MPHVSITRLRIRSYRFMPSFAVLTWMTTRQARRADGFLAGSLLPDRARTFWTMTLWRNSANMKRFITDGAHRKAMPKLLDWCDEASIVHWNQVESVLPDWVEADRRMRAQGRPSKVRHPSAAHRNLSYAEPRMSRAASI